MSAKPFPIHPRRGFTFLEVLLVLGICGMMVLCLIGFVLSKTTEPLKITPPKPTPAPAAATPAPAAATPAPATPAPPPPAPAP